MTKVELVRAILAKEPEYKDRKLFSMYKSDLELMYDRLCNRLTKGRAISDEKVSKNISNHNSGFHHGRYFNKEVL